MSWIADLQRVLGQQPACVLVTLNLISGSAPRESGSKMIVTLLETLGSIGGGNLEHQATLWAREMLQKYPHGHQEQVLYGLGPKLNQCCGGAVALLYEVLGESSQPWLEQVQASLNHGQPLVLAYSIEQSPAIRAVVRSGGGSDPELPGEVVEAAGLLLEQPGKIPGGHLQELAVNGAKWWLELIREQRHPVMLFGAGHVGQAVIRVLAPLPFRVTWVDSRAGVFPQDIAANIQRTSSADPRLELLQAPPGCIFIVMTHSHQLDEDICFDVLNRGDFAWLGLIGSATKRRRFVHRLAQRGIEASQLHKLICPIGLDSIHGKQPATIALSLAAQLMTHYSE